MALVKAKKMKPAGLKEIERAKLDGRCTNMGSGSLPNQKRA
jgi:hypothetical protein